MFRTLAVISALLLGAPTQAAPPASEPILALWEYDGWAAPTPERPLGLRFALLADGSVIFSPDDPAWDRLIPAGFFQAQLSPEEAAALVGRIDDALAAAAAEAQLPARAGDWTAFYFRDPESGAARRAEFTGHPCLARFRVFSATAPVAGLKANRNSADRAALSPGLREVCDLLTGFHHAGTRPWNAGDVPVPMP